jgi:hypothetical protein
LASDSVGACLHTLNGGSVLCEHNRAVVYKGRWGLLFL